ncbi:MAG TPA: MFS transporter [Marinobacter sp.]|nr:MFS transporter [Marinobacter sp.]
MPLNVWILVAAQALAMCTAPFIVFIGSIQGRMLAPSEGLATLPVGMVVVGTVLAIKPATALMARTGRKPVMLLGGLMGVAAGLTGATAAWLSSFPLLCLAALLGGTGLAVVHQYRFAAMESVPPSLAGSAAARVLLGGLIAAWLGPEVALQGRGAVGPASFLDGWLALAAVQGLAMLVLGLGYRTRSELPRETAIRQGRPMGEILSQPLIWAAIGAAAIGYAVMSFIMTATPLSMTEMAGHSLQDAKQVIQIHIVAMYLPSLISGWLTRTLGLPVMLVMGLLAYLACILLALSGIDFHHYLSGLILLGIGWNFLFVAGTTLLPRGYNDEERFRVQGLNDLMVFGSQATAALTAGLALSAFGWSGVLLLVLPLLVLQAILVVAWQWRERRAMAG